MAVIQSQENIEELRKRLYSRTENNEKLKRQTLSPQKFDVSRGWGKRAEGELVKTVKETTNLNDEVEDLNSVADIEEQLIEENVSAVPLDTVSKKKKYSFRILTLLVSFGILILAIFASAFYFLSGSNQISANDISIDVKAPFSVAGGDKLPLQLVVANENSVDIESVSLILNYPAGAKAGDDSGKDIYEERIPVENIKAGEVKSISTDVFLYGEENEDKEIKARLEYRVANSNSFFQKEAGSVFVKLSSSPLVLKIDAIKKISSGQEMDITLTINSNSSNPLKNILVNANFPNNFSIIRSEPVLSFGQNTWFFDEIAPNKTYTIKIRGLVSGLTGEEADIKFEIGNARSDNQFALSSVLGHTKSSFIIERSFIDVLVKVGGKTGNEITLDPKENATIDVVVKNTLAEPIYDMRIEAEPRGNVFSEKNISINNGFFNDATKTINWEISGVPSLKEVLSGQSRTVSFSFRKKDENLNDASFDVSVKVFARRVNESKVNEEQIGSSLISVKYKSSVSLNNEISYKESPFSDSGPIPPVVNKKTTYTITLEAGAGTNDLKDGIITTSLPPFVDWVDKTEGEGRVEFNPVSKQLRWEVGSISANGKKQLKFQIAVLPTITQVGQALEVLRRQTFTATDAFTGTSLTAIAGSLRNELSPELGFSKNNGNVVAE